jgi:hypothetical protein
MSLGGGIQALGQIKQGQIAAAQGDFEKEIQARNQKALNRQADAELAASKIEEERISRRSKITQARLKVGQSKSGIGLAGATINALTDAAFQFSMDRNLTLRRGLIKSRELRQRGAIMAAQGRFAKVVGREKRFAAFLGAAGTFAGSGSSTDTNPQQISPTIGGHSPGANRANTVPGARGGL